MPCGCSGGGKSLKKKKFLPQLNKSSFLKLIVFVAIVVLVEIAAGLFIFNEYSAKTYRQEFASYGGRADTLSYNVNEKYSSELDGLNGNTELIEKIKADCKLSAQFDYYVIFSEGQGGVVIDGGGLLKEGEALKISYNLSFNAVGTVEIKGKTFVFAPSALGDSGYRKAQGSKATAGARAQAQAVFEIEVGRSRARAENVGTR